MKTDESLTEKAKVGILGEKAAIKYLKKQKYKIIAHNVHAGRSEIDVIALNNDTLVFVEVKTRAYEEGKSYFSRPADAVNKSKASYLIRGAGRFLSENGAKYSSFYKRFDIIEVYLTKKKNKYSVADVRHFEDSIRRQI